MSSNSENMSTDGSSVLLNYSDYYDEWFEAETEECHECYGTGMDKDEMYDCPACWGEGVIILAS
jgi:hypothetical protein